MEILGLIAAIAIYFFLIKPNQNCKTETSSKPKYETLFKKKKPALRVKYGLLQYSPDDDEIISPEINRELKDMARMKDWKCQPTSIKGKIRRNAFKMSLFDKSWKVTIQSQFSAGWDFHLEKEMYKTQPDELVHSTGDRNFDKEFSLRSKNPGATLLFLNLKNRKYITEHFKKYSSITFNKEEKNLSIHFFSPNQESNRGPSPGQFMKVLAMANELDNLSVDPETILKTMSEERLLHIQNQFCNAAFFSFYTNEQFMDKAADLLASENNYIRNLASIVYHGTLTDPTSEIGVYADLLGTTCLALEKHENNIMKYKPFMALYDYLSTPRLKEKVISRCCSTTVSKNDGLETFLVSKLLDIQLSNNSYYEILEALKSLGTTGDTVEGIKVFKDKNENKKLDKASDEVIKTIIHRIDGNSIEGRLSFAEVSNQGGLSVDDE